MLFSKAVTTAVDQGAEVIIEIGPKPILQSYLRQVVADQDVKGAVLSSLTTEQFEDADPVVHLVARAFIAGASVDTNKLFGKNPEEPVILPPLPWQNKSFRFENSSEANMGIFRGGNHPLLGWRPNENYNLWTTHLDRSTVPFLEDHVINGQMIFPGTGYVEMALAAGSALYGSNAVELRSMDILQALVLSDEYLAEVKTEISEETGTVKISSRMRLSGDDWTLHAVGRVAKLETKAPNIQLDFEAARLISSGEDIYKTALTYGLEFGPRFQRTQNVSQVDQATFIVCLSALDEEDKVSSFGLHPAELDGCFHGLLSLFRENTTQNSRPKAYVPIFFDKVRQYQSGASPAYVRIQVKRASELSILADFQIFDDDDNVIATIVGGRFRATELGRKDNLSDLIYRVETSLQRNPAATGDALGHNFPPMEDYVAEKFRTFEDEAEREAYLLLAAAAQRTAFDIISKFTDSEQTVSLQDLPRQHRRYFVNLLTILQEAGAATECGSNRFDLNSDFELPEFDLLVASVLEESPQDIAAATILATTRKFLLDGLEQDNFDNQDLEHSSAMLEQYWYSSPEALTRCRSVSHWLKTALSEWDREKPLHVLDLSGSGLSLAKDIQQILPDYVPQISIADSNHKSARGYLQVLWTNP